MTDEERKQAIVNAYRSWRDQPGDLSREDESKRQGAMIAISMLAHAFGWLDEIKARIAEKNAARDR